MRLTKTGLGGAKAADYTDGSAQHQPRSLICVNTAATDEQL